MRHWGEKLCNTCMLQLRNTFPSHLHDFDVFKEVTVASLLARQDCQKEEETASELAPVHKNCLKPAGSRKISGDKSS